jgi:excisionase family DNA binding protein
MKKSRTGMKSARQDQILAAAWRAEHDPDGTAFPRAYSSTEIAAMTGLCAATIRRQIQHGQLKSVKITPRMIRVTAEDLNAWWAAGGGTQPLVPESAEGFAEWLEARAVSMSGV